MYVVSRVMKKLNNFFFYLIFIFTVYFVVFRHWCGAQHSPLKGRVQWSLSCFGEKWEINREKFRPIDIRLSGLHKNKRDFRWHSSNSVVKIYLSTSIKNINNNSSIFKFGSGRQARLEGSPIPASICHPLAKITFLWSLRQSVVSERNRPNQELPGRDLTD